MKNFLEKFFTTLAFWIESLVSLFVTRMKPSTSPEQSSSKKIAPLGVITRAKLPEPKALERALDELSCAAIAALIQAKTVLSQPTTPPASFLKNQKVLYITASESRIWSVLSAAQPALVVDYDYSTSYKNLKIDAEIPNHFYRIKGAIHEMPFEEAFFDTVLFFATDQEPASSSLNEIRRVLKKNGTLLLAARHPALKITTGHYGEALSKTFKRLAEFGFQLVTFDEAELPNSAAGEGQAGFPAVTAWMFTAQKEERSEAKGERNDA